MSNALKRLHQFKDIIRELRATKATKQAVKEHVNTIRADMLNEMWKSNNSIPGWQRNICKHLAELLLFNSTKIQILVHFTTNIKKFDRWTTDNLKRIIKNLKLAYSMCNQVDILTQILKF